MNGFTLPTLKTQNQNLLKNPAFSVIQGSASGTLANSLAVATASLGYSGETEWCLAAAGGTPAYAFSAIDEQVTITGASGVTAVYLLQRIESRDSNRIKGKAVTFSVELASSQLTSVVWEVFRPTTLADQHGTIANPTQTLVASGTWNISSSFQRYLATFDLPIQASLGLEVRIRGGALTSGTLVISRPQLELGGAATDFNCGDYSQELEKCKRYYESGSYYESQYNLTGFSWLKDVNFSQEKFAAAGVTTSNETFGGFAGLTNISTTSKKFSYDTDASANTGQHVISFDWQASAHIP